MQALPKTPIVSDIRQRELRPKVASKWASYLPDICNVSYSFVLEGANVSIANGIRRAVAGELPVKRMTCAVEDVVTNDVFLIPEKVISQIQSVPIMQHIKLGERFVLRATNDSTCVRKVHTASIKEAGGKSTKALFNDNMVLFDLQPGTGITIELQVVDGMAANSGEGMASHACLPFCRPLDVEPLLPYKVVGDRVEFDFTRGVSSLMMDPRKHHIGFTTNGTIPCDVLVKTACASLAARCQAVNDAKTEFQLQDEYVLELQESPTIGEIFMRAVLDICPENQGVRYKEDTISGTIILRCRCDDITDIVSRAMTHAREQFIAIAKQF